MIDIDMSVFRSERRSIDDVERDLRRRGWKKVSEKRGGRVRYMENKGINLSLIQLPFRTVVVPSGPVRGFVFGDNVSLISSGQD